MFTSPALVSVAFAGATMLAGGLIAAADVSAGTTSTSTSSATTATIAPAIAPAIAPGTAPASAGPIPIPVPNIDAVPQRPAPAEPTTPTQPPAADPGPAPAPDPAPTPGPVAPASPPADCDVVFYPELFVATDIDGDGTTTNAQIEVLPNQTVPFGNDIIVGTPIDGNYTLVLSVLEHMTGRGGDVSISVFGDIPAFPLDVTVDTVGKWYDPQYRVEAQVNRLDNELIEVTDIRFTHRRCGIDAVAEAPTDGVFELAPHSVID